MSAKTRRVAVVTGDHHLPDPTKRGQRYNEEDLITHNAMAEALRGLPGYEISVHSRHEGLFQRLEAERPDLVINFCDTGLFNVPTQELHLPARLELLGIPYTGAPPAAMVICYDKEIVRLIAQAHGVPVPREAFIAAADPLDTLPGFYPGLIKPNTADGSVGITKDAVVRDEAQARAYLDWLRATLPGRDALYQEYLPGAEYGIGLIGNADAQLTALPALEVDYSKLPKGLSPILSFESKAMPDSPYWTEIKFARARLDPAAEEQLGARAQKLFKRLGLRDYGRFDFRVGADGEPKLMEVNPNPAWSNDGKLAFMAGFAGLSYQEMLGLFLDGAIARVERERAR